MKDGCSLKRHHAEITFKINYESMLPVQQWKINHNLFKVLADEVCKSAEALTTILIYAASKLTK